MAKLFKLIKKRYKTNLLYIHWIQAKPTELSRHQKELLKAGPIHLDKKSFFPIYLKDEMIGAAEITPTTHLTDKKVEEIYEIITLVLESTISTARNLDDLHKLEGHLHTNESDKTVVRLARTKPVVEQEFINPEIFIPKNQKGNFDLPCIVFGNNYDENFKLALELHHLSHRYALVHIEDINIYNFDGAEELCKLGPVSLFIGEIAELSKKAQYILLNYLNHNTDGPCPQVLASTIYSKAELMKRSLICPELLDKLCTVYLKMEKDFEHYKKSGITRFYLDSMNSSIY